MIKVTFFVSFPNAYGLMMAFVKSSLIYRLKRFHTNIALALKIYLNLLNMAAVAQSPDENYDALCKLEGMKPLKLSNIARIFYICEEKIVHGWR